MYCQHLEHWLYRDSSLSRTVITQVKFSMGASASKSSSSSSSYDNDSPPCFSLFCPPQMSKKTSDALGSPMPTTPLDRLRHRKTVMQEAYSNPIYLSRYWGLEKDRSDEWCDTLPPPPTNEAYCQPQPPQEAEIHEADVSEHNRTGACCRKIKLSLLTHILTITPCTIRKHNYSTAGRRTALLRQIWTPWSPRCWIYLYMPQMHTQGTQRRLCLQNHWQAATRGTISRPHGTIPNRNSSVEIAATSQYHSTLWCVHITESHIHRHGIDGRWRIVRLRRAKGNADGRRSESDCEKGHFGIGIYALQKYHSSGYEAGKFVAEAPAVAENGRRFGSGSKNYWFRVKQGKESVSSLHAGGARLFHSPNERTNLPGPIQFLPVHGGIGCSLLFGNTGLFGSRNAAAAGIF